MNNPDNIPRRTFLGILPAAASAAILSPGTIRSFAAADSSASAPSENPSPGIMPGFASSPGQPASQPSQPGDAVSFPPDFIWGAATAAYQVEGAATQDGRGPSVWDQFCKKTGAIHEGNTGDVACDHYNRFQQDIGLMRDIGLRAYRFSVSWPRVLPAGAGPVNAPGLSFYDRLVDSLLHHGIQPWLTLFHWDYPLALFQRGGWLNPDSPHWFADYTALIVDRLSDRVTHWMTINEPQCFIGLGHLTGVHAPGQFFTPEQALTAAHHVLLAHGLAAQTIRARAKQKPQVGWAIVCVTSFPQNPSDPAHIDAARRRMFTIDDANPAAVLWSNTWWADPVILGHYPADGLNLLRAHMPPVTDADMRAIHQPLDFYGLNIYSGEPVHPGPGGQPIVVPGLPGRPRTLFGWDITPEALHWGPRLIHERYHTPILITENGMSNPDWVMADDAKVHDPQRIDFTKRYLRQLGRAIQAGVPVRGYFHWSLLDNFEWAEGYKQRFGLIHVDYQTLARTPKDSAHWYSQLIRSGQV